MGVPAPIDGAISMHNRYVRLLPILLVLVLANLATVVVSARSPLRVLFIGNSLTYSNDLPAMVAALPCFADGRKIYVETIAGPNMSLADHLTKRTASAALKGRWDVVVLQQGPSALRASRKELLESVRLFAPAIRAAGAHPAMLAVWPSSQRFADFDDVMDPIGRLPTRPTRSCCRWARRGARHGVVSLG